MDTKAAALELIEAAAKRLDLSLTEGESALLRMVIEPLAGTSIYVPGPESVDSVDLPTTGREYEIRAWRNTDRRYAHGMLQLIALGRVEGVARPRRLELGIVYALVFHVTFPVQAAA